MVLIDTSVWVDHFKADDMMVRDLLIAGRVLIHPWVVGELALGIYADRASLIRDLGKLELAVAATDAELRRFIEDNALYGIGIGYVDAGLLASTKLTPGASFWTRDKRLRAAAERLSIAARLIH